MSMSNGEGSRQMQFPTPVPNASLLLSFRPTARKIVILGTKRLAASRIFSILEADAIPVVIDTDCDDNADLINEEVQWRIKQGQCEYIRAPNDDRSAWSSLLEGIDGADNLLFAVCVTDTLHAGDAEADGELKEGRDTKMTALQRAKILAKICKAKRIPINVADQPLLCDYSFPACHRFSSSSTKSTASSLQVAVTTNGRGCRLAGRIRREIVSSLPKNVGDAVEKVGQLREMAKRGNGHLQENGNGHPSQRPTSLRRTALKRAKSSTANQGTLIDDVEEEDLSFDSTPLNSPVPQLSSPTGEGFFHLVTERLKIEQDDAEERKRRMRWVAQMSEYWPIEYLGNLTATEMEKALETYADRTKQDQQPKVGETSRGRTISRRGSVDVEASLAVNGGTSRRATSQHSLTIDRPDSNHQTSGHVFLVGSGTGHPGLLTTFAHNLLTSTETDLILSDKLVPSSILSLIPKSTPLQIARKFPGNAEGAQSELIYLAQEAALEGKRVIRLKQGDPFVYGRGGEEVLAFRKAGVACTVVPGISSALAAPLMLGIPVTQRGAADSLTLCTGVGRGGKSVRLPGYERSRSLIVLMGVARLKDVVHTLCHGWQSQLHTTPSTDDPPSGQRLGEPFPPYTPIAIIERASSNDQRMVASTLDGIHTALTQSGEQRPPGMMLIGWAALALSGIDGNVDVLDDEDQCGHDVAELERRDRARVKRWLGDSGHIVKEGLDEFYSRYLGLWNDKQPAPQEHVTAQAGLHGKDEAGWAPPRYGLEGPKGGWGANEVQLPTQ